MPQSIAIWMTRVLLLYVVLGLAFAVPFVTVGVGTVDPAARRTSWIFRVLLVAGSTLLWPWLLARWVGHRRRSIVSPDKLAGKDGTI